jgi:hypothetical protein
VKDLIIAIPLAIAQELAQGVNEERIGLEI